MVPTDVPCPLSLSTYVPYSWYSSMLTLITIKPLILQCLSNAFCRAKEKLYGPPQTATSCR